MSEPTAAAQLARAPGRFMAVLLAALTAIGPFSIDTYLPSFHDMAVSLGATPLQVQQTLTAYFLPFAAMMLWHGAISDALGRRRVVLVGVAGYLLASLVCVLATRIEHVWLARAAQGVSAGVGMVVGRAIVRDIYEGPAAQRMMSHVMMIFALAPAVAPVIGGWLQTWFGWRAVFLFLAAFSALLLVACWRWLPETLPVDRRHSLQPGPLARAYAQVLTDRPFLATAGGLAFNFAGMFLYVLAAPVFLIQHLGLSEREFAWLFVPATSGLMIGGWLSGRLAGRLPPLRLLRLGYLLMGGAALLNLAINLWAPGGVAWYVVCIPAYTTGMALSIPVMTLFALDRFPHRRGLASSCQGFVQTGFNALAAGVLVPLLWGSRLTLAFGMAGFLCLGALLAWISRRAAASPAD